jgi:hypothetical protein
MMAEGETTVGPRRFCAGRAPSSGIEKRWRATPDQRKDHAERIQSVTPRQEGRGRLPAGVNCHVICMSGRVSFSRVIRSYGLLNTTVAADSFSFGIPYPGTFILDHSRTVKSKYFEADFRERYAVADILVREFDVRRRP